MGKPKITPDRDGGCWLEFDGARNWYSSRIDAYKTKRAVEAMQRAGAKIERDRNPPGNCNGYYIDGEWISDLDRLR